MRALTGLLVVSGRLRQRLEDACAPAGLSHHQYNTLRILRGAGEAGRTRGEVAARLIDRAPDVTRLLDRLAQRGLVQRHRGRKDRRTSRARLTPEGAAALARVDEAIREVRREFFAGLSAEEMAQLSGVLELLVEPPSESPSTRG